MSQEFHVIQCFNCKTFQVHQVKKSKKWNCKLCGEKQSIVKVYAQGSGAYCRHHVQQLNMIRGGLETAKNEQVQSLHATPLLSTSKHQSCYNEFESYIDGKNQHSRWTHYTEPSADQEVEAHCPADEDSSDVIYTTDRMLLARQPGKRKKKVQSSDEGYTDDDLEEGQAKQYVNRSNKNVITSETMKLKPFTNFGNGSQCQFQKPKSKVVETFGEADVKHFSSTMRNAVLDGKNYAESFCFAGNKFQQNILKRNAFVEQEISSEMTDHNENIDLNKGNILVGFDSCIKNSPFDEIDGSKTFYKFQRDTQSDNEFESRDQSGIQRTGNRFHGAIKPSEKTTGSQPVKTSIKENLSKLNNQSKWSRYIEEDIDDENSVHCGEASCQGQSVKYGELQFNNPSEGEDEFSVLTYNPDCHLKYTDGNQENSNKNVLWNMNSEYGHDINVENGSHVSIYHGKRNMFMSNTKFVDNCSKQSELHIKSHAHKDAKGCEISVQKGKVSKSKCHWFTVGNISDDEFEL
ncbi:hypothetical protein CHS0354_035618 [Potamilus streckersoni]|uniref:MRN complex-interacting protein N-terminal domain-containing protein n=1 Tax=Potamilus streckersoni TaxID=2493646 RepID=A0AAE0VIS6_9BIVA|nr:hypothetical protein CHS0354_035618 [Potamilus streckersoni]